MLGGRLRRGRRAAHRDHGVDRRVAGIGDRDVARLDVRLVVGGDRAGPTCVALIDVEADILLAERARREHEPGVFLRRGALHEIARGVDPLGGADQDRLRRIAFRRKRHHHRGVAQAASRSRCGRSRSSAPWRATPSATSNTFSARTRSPSMASAAPISAFAVARLEVVDLGVGEVAKIADRSHAVPRQHVERVGERQVRRRSRGPARCSHNCASGRARA